MAFYVGLLMLGGVAAPVAAQASIDTVHTFLQRGTGAVARSSKQKFLEAPVTVVDFGARPAPFDSTTAFQNTINAARGRKIVVPCSATGYKITRTLTISNRDGFSLEFECSNVGRDGVSQIEWYGAAKPVISFIGINARGRNTVFSVDLANISINGNAGGTRASVCMAFGTLGAVYNELFKSIHTRNITLRNCRIGAWFGRDLATADDIASHTHINWYVDGNTDHGIYVGTGNGAGINFIGSTFSGNGYSAKDDAINGSHGRGTNVYLSAGELTLTGNITTGAGATQPKTSDIYMNGNSMRINGHWSDTRGPFLTQTGAWQTLYLNGVRHYEGGMTDANTPTSIRATARIVLENCYLFGDVTVSSGNGGSILSIGTQFHSGVPRTVQGTFKGDIITTFNGLMRLNEVGNGAQLLRGGGARSPAHVGAVTPADVVMGNTTISQWLSNSALDSGHTIFATATDGSLNYLVNGYFSDAAANVKPHKIGLAYRIIIGATPQPRVYAHNFADTTTAVALSSFTDLTAVSADHGDAAATLTVGLSAQTQRWATAITADRAVMLSATNAYIGAKFSIVRTAAATGAFKLNVGADPLKVLTAGTWCEVTYDGTAWILTAAGSL